MKNGIDFKIDGNSQSNLLIQNGTLICQIALAEITKYDKEGLLPSDGILTFKYDLASNANGYKFAADRAYYSVSYNEDSLNEGYKFKIEVSNTYADSDDCDIIGLPNEGKNPRNFSLRMLGWPTINDNCTLLLELNRRHFNLDKGLSDIAPHVIRRAKQEGIKWVMLLQINSIDNVLSIGDAGSLYFYIREEDLAKKDFSKCYMIREEC